MRTVVARTIAPGLSAVQRLFLETEAIYAELLEARVAELKARRPVLERDLVEMRGKFLRLGDLSWGCDGRLHGERGLESRSLEGSSAGVVVVEVEDDARVVSVSDLLDVCALRGKTTADLDVTVESEKALQEVRLEFDEHIRWPRCLVLVSDVFEVVLTRIWIPLI